MNWNDVTDQSGYQRRKQERIARFNKLKGVKQTICIACNGSGYYDHDGSPKCGSCNGTGKVRVPKN